MKLVGMRRLEQLSREELLELAKDTAKRWLALDGVWFQCIEGKSGIETAIEMDTLAWERYGKIEAERIMKTHKIPPNGGIPALINALELRQYSLLNDQEAVEISENRVVFRMNSCRSQLTRIRKGLPDFPCKPVGIAEYTSFAKGVDPRIKTRCIACPPDSHPENYFCAWEFTIEEE